MPEPRRYAVAELAELGGVSRRTIRFYVQEGLLPPPLGIGRGSHYAQEHLDRLLQVKALQEEGTPLEAIRRRLRGAAEEVLLAAPQEVERDTWTRLVLGPGIELHVTGGRRLPAPGKLADLAAWCRREFPPR
jgi:DNA-binding transcriptional MerR regulator